LLVGQLQIASEHGYKVNTDIQLLNLDSHLAEICNTDLLDVIFSFLKDHEIANNMVFLCILARGKIYLGKGGVM